MESDGDEFGANGAETARRAAVLRPLVRDYLAGISSLESGVRDAVWELGVSRATVWRWIRRLAEEGGRTSSLAPRKRGRRAGTVLVSREVEVVIEEHLTRYYLRRESPSLGRVVKEIRNACGALGLQMPTWTMPPLWPSLARQTEGRPTRNPNRL